MTIFFKEVQVWAKGLAPQENFVQRGYMEVLGLKSTAEHDRLGPIALGSLLKKLVCTGFFLTDPKKNSKKKPVLSCYNIQTIMTSLKF
jgi:hypothetical protein